MTFLKSLHQSQIIYIWISRPMREKIPNLFKPFSWFSITCKHTHTPLINLVYLKIPLLPSCFLGVWLEIEFQVDDNFPSEFLRP